MKHAKQPANPEVDLITAPNGEITLYMNGDEAMQGWEQELMEFSADILAPYGKCFLEAGLGLGYSAERMASHAERHVVIEAYPRVIELYRERRPNPPAPFEIVVADFFEYIDQCEPESFDGIFYDLALEKETHDDEDFMREGVRAMKRVIRKGGALVPFFMDRPKLSLPFAEEFDVIHVYRKPYVAYPTTNYVTRSKGNAYVQCFVK